VRLFDGHRADVHSHTEPPVIIEFKIFDEQCAAGTVAGDIQKLKRFAGECCVVGGLVGVMICETPGTPLQQRIDRLKATLGASVHVGPEQSAKSGKWKWCFGCVNHTDVTAQL
jgi:hypothetical protein